MKTSFVFGVIGLFLLVAIMAWLILFIVKVALLLLPLIVAVVIGYWLYKTISKSSAKGVK